MVTIDQKIAELLNNWYVDGWPIGNFIACVIALILATVLCGVIGIEREKRGRTAGLRTHLLVGMGSCLIMIISIYGFPASTHTRDVARLAAQVITGVGFLGAGAIIHRNSKTRGLTTAATIWIVMAIGLACGSLNYILATGATILMVMVLTIFRKVEGRLTKDNPYILLHAYKDTPVMSKVLLIAEEYDVVISDLSTEILEDGRMEITFMAIGGSSNFRLGELLEKFENVEGVISARTLNNEKQ